MSYASEVKKELTGITVHEKRPGRIDGPDPDERLHWAG